VRLDTPRSHRLSRARLIFVIPRSSPLRSFATAHRFPLLPCFFVSATPLSLSLFSPHSDPQHRHEKVPRHPSCVKRRLSNSMAFAARLSMRFCSTTVASFPTTYFFIFVPPKEVVQRFRGLVFARDISHPSSPLAAEVQVNALTSPRLLVTFGCMFHIRGVCWLLLHRARLGLLSPSADNLLLFFPLWVSNPPMSLFPSIMTYPEPAGSVLFFFFWTAAPPSSIYFFTTPCAAVSRPPVFPSSVTG